MNDTRERRCCPSGKVPHANRGAAKEVLARLRRRHHGTAVRRAEQQIYRCPFCRLWHVTSRRTVATSR